jgi:ssDNA-binding Zn-finger/Zn-ribbon topoisomerase 1
MPAKEMTVCDDFEEGEEILFACGDGITMECVCPKCGAHHRMKILWAGRGKPRKFCQACKMYIATLEAVELPCMPAAVNRALG